MGGSNSTCSICKTSVQKEFLFSHTEQHHPDYVCSFCKEIFMFSVFRLSHMIQNHHQCKFCDQYFATMQSLEDHKQKAHLTVVCLVCKVERFTKEQIPLCENCQIKISAKEDWTAYIRQSYPHYVPHVITNSPSNRSSSIDNSYETKRAQELRLEQQKREKEQQRIEQQRLQLLRIRQEEQLRLQQQREAEAQLQRQREAELRLQREKQQEEEERLKYLKRLQQIRQQEKQEEQLRLQQQREAEVRLQQQRLQQELRSKQKQTNNRNQEKCEKCGSRFHSKEDKNEHIEKDHIKCSTCSKQFNNKYELKKHILMAHPYCLICEHPEECDITYSGSRFGTAVALQKHVEEYHNEIFLRPRRFFSNFKCTRCKSGWRSALTWGVFLPYPEDHPRHEPSDDDEDDDDDDDYYKDSEDENDYYDEEDDYYDDEDDENLGVFNNRLRFQTRNASNELGEIFIFYPQDCRNCGNSCMPFKCTYLQCSRCQEDVRNCSCPRAHWKAENYDENAPHRQDLCSRCAYLGRGCWLNG